MRLTRHGPPCSQLPLAPLAGTPSQEGVLMTIPAKLLNGSTNHAVSAGIITGMFVAMSERERLEFMYRGLDQCYVGARYSMLARDAKLRRPVMAPPAILRAVLRGVDDALTDEEFLTMVVDHEPLPEWR